VHPRDTIARYVTLGLPDAEAHTLRKHLASCADCRAFYDEQRVLLRALAGDANAPTPDEVALHRGLAIRAIFGESPVDARPTLGDVVDRLLWVPLRTWTLGAVALTALVIASLAVLRPSGPNIEPLAARVAHATAATLGVEPLLKGSEVRAGDPLVVKKGGMLELELVRGGTVRVFSESRLALGARGETVSLESGKIWCIPDEGRGRFEVSTSTASVRVLGTSFIVESRAERTDVRVVSGRVEVVDHGARGKVQLKRDESTHVTAGRAPSPARRASTSADTSEWQRFFDQLLNDLKRSMKILEGHLRQVAD